MGIFNKKYSLSSNDVKQIILPYIEMIKEIESTASGIDQNSKDWIKQTEEVVAQVYVFTARTHIESKQLMKLFKEGTISDAAGNAAMQSLHLLTDQTDQRMAFITQTLIDSRMSYELGIKFFKNSWSKAKKIAPVEIADLEKDMGKQTKWSWINKTSWI